MKEITIEKFEELKRKNEYLKVMGIRFFTEPSHLWMKKRVKHRMKKVFNLGFWKPAII